MRILSLVLTFISKCRRKLTAKQDTSQEQPKFSLFHVQLVSQEQDGSEAGQVGSSHDTVFLTHFRDQKCKTDEKFALTQTEYSDAGVLQPSDKYIHQALVYLYSKAALEVLQFNPKAKVDKVAIMKGGILFSKGRILDGMNFVQTGGLELQDLGQLGIKAHIPVVDRHSPLAYSIANHVHWELAKHKGIETCNRISLSHVNILQGASLYKELGE